MRAGMHEMHALQGGYHWQGAHGVCAMGEKKKSPEPFGSRDESLIRGTTLLAPSEGPLRAPLSPIPVTGETVSHY